MKVRLCARVWTPENQVLRERVKQESQAIEGKAARTAKQ
jgi:hypothetical protein